MKSSLEEAAADDEEVDFLELFRVDESWASVAVSWTKTSAVRPATISIKT